MALVKGTNARTGKVETWRPLPQQGRGPVVDRAPAPQPRDVFRVQPAPVNVPVPVTVGQSPVPVTMGRSPVPVTVQVVPEPTYQLPPQQTPLEMAGVFESRDPRTLEQAGRSTWGNLENEGAAGMMQAKDNASGALPQALQRIHEQQMINVADQYNAQARMGERDRARREREGADRKEKRQQLTLAEWNAYSPLQQAAVQANADLYAAVQRDIKSQSKHGRVGDEGRRENAAGLKAYQEATGELFREDQMLGVNGLEFAPNTVAFLESRGIDRNALAGRSLDDILMGDTLFTKAVIDRLDQEVPALDPFKTGQQQTQRESNIAFAQALAKGQLQYQEKLASTLKQGEQLLTSMTARGTNAEAQNDFGARGMADAAKLTKVRPETQAQLDKYMESLARPELDPAESMKVIELDLQQRGANQEEINQVYRSLEDRVRLGMQGNGKWFPGVDYELRSPAEVGQILGLTTLKREGD